MKAKPKFHELRFSVSGSGEFPIDMLRYENAVPDTGSDAARLSQSRELRTIRLRMFRQDPKAKPEFARWQSFLWTASPATVTP